MSDVPAILVRCDGSPEIGLGHVVRCLALANELRERHGCAVAFAVRRDELGVRLLEGAGYPVLRPDPNVDFDYRDWLRGSIGATSARVLVLDVRDELSKQDVAAVAAQTGVAVAVIDDLSEKRMAASDVFYPPVPQLDGLDWTGFTGRVHVGWEWVLLSREFAREPVRASRDVPVVLVTMGGTDPAGLTLMVVEALAEVSVPFECSVLRGPGFMHDERLIRLLEDVPGPVRVVRDGDVRAEMVASDLAVISFGVTAYEAAACGLPALHLSLTEDHALSSSAFGDAGIAVPLGLAEDVTSEVLQEAVTRLLTDAVRRCAMSKAARGLVDGAGAKRVAALLMERVGGSRTYA